MPSITAMKQVRRFNTVYGVLCECILLKRPSFMAVIDGVCFLDARV